MTTACEEDDKVSGLELCIATTTGATRISEEVFRNRECTGVEEVPETNVSDEEILEACSAEVDFYDQIAESEFVSIDRKMLEACQALGRARPPFFLDRNPNFFDRNVQDEYPGAVCDKIVTGTAIAETPCFVGLMCAAGLECIYKKEAGETRCLGAAAEGEHCGRFRSCSVGLQCVEEFCVQKVELGGSCDNVIACQDGSYCKEGTCIGRAGLGESCEDVACEESAVCDENLRCIPYIDPNVCEPVCGVNENCSQGICVVNIELGEYCIFGEDVCAGSCVSCRPDEQGTPRCQSPGLIEEGCFNNSDCFGDLVCFEALCHEPLLEGVACSNTEDCSTGLACRNSVCIADAQPGEPCDEDRPCDGRCIEGQCVVSPACFVDGDCQVGEECEGAWNCDEGLGCSLAQLCVELPVLGQECLSNTCADAYYCDEELLCQNKKARIRHAPMTTNALQVTARRYA